jgi:hypothetical protein
VPGNPFPHSEGTSPPLFVPEAATMAKRELIDTGTDKRYVRRNRRGQFDEVEDVGRSLAADRRQRAKTKAKRGEGDKGDRAAKSVVGKAPLGSLPSKARPKRK